MKSKQNVVVLECKKSFFFRKLTEISNLILCFSEIPKVFICFRVKQVAVLSEDCKKLSVWWSVFFTVFALVVYLHRFVNGIKRVCASQQGLHIRAWPIYAGFTVCSLMIICKYLSLNYKPDYQRSGLNTYYFTSLFQWFKKVFDLIQQKWLNFWKIKMIEQIK